MGRIHVLSHLQVHVPLVVVGDHAYPALPWLMKPFPERADMTAAKKCYNYWQSRTRMAVENVLEWLLEMLTAKNGFHVGKCA